MRRTIENLRQQPSEVRWHVTFIVSFAVTFLIASVWLTTDPFTDKYAEERSKNSGGQLAAPLIAVGEEVSGIYQKTEKQLEQFRQEYDQ
jgi:hypothetical protein